MEGNKTLINCYNYLGTLCNILCTYEKDSSSFSDINIFYNKMDTITAGKLKDRVGSYIRKYKSCKKCECCSESEKITEEQEKAIESVARSNTTHTLSLHIKKLPKDFTDELLNLLHGDIIVRKRILYSTFSNHSIY